MHEYPVRRAPRARSWREGWASPYWAAADVARLAHFLPGGSDHRPTTESRLLYDDESLTGCFRVADRYVRSVCTQANGPVHLDSCVEFFVQPRAARGYFNFEFNAGGTLHAGYIIDPARTATGFKSFHLLDPSLLRRIEVAGSLPGVVEPERPEPTAWQLAFRIPFAVLENEAGPLGDVAGDTWRGNFFKCADATSHPHWAAWSPVPVRNFHLPECFGELRFA
jgi:hypothetical protein